MLKLGKDIDALAKQLIDIKTGETLMQHATLRSVAGSTQYYSKS
ncbi:hypothetical protein N8D25_16675 (plasmid) [Enterococcus faecium]